MDPGDELARAERLGEVVVGADGEADDQVGLGVAGREHEDRYRALPLDALAHLEAVEAGEHEVEDDEVGLEPLARLHAAGTVAGDLDGEALAAEPGRDGFRDRCFVLDHEDRACVGGSAASSDIVGHATEAP